jgi:hypothetical protein
MSLILLILFFSNILSTSDALTTTTIPAGIMAVTTTTRIKIRCPYNLESMITKADRQVVLITEQILIDSE